VSEYGGVLGFWGYGDKKQNPGTLFVEIGAKQNEYTHFDQHINMHAKVDIDPISALVEPVYTYKHPDGTKLNFKFKSSIKNELCTHSQEPWSTFIWWSK